MTEAMLHRQCAQVGGVIVSALVILRPYGASSRRQLGRSFGVMLAVQVQKPLFVGSDTEVVDPPSPLIHFPVTLPLMATCAPLSWGMSMLGKCTQFVSLPFLFKVGHLRFGFQSHTYHQKKYAQEKRRSKDKQKRRTRKRKRNDKDHSL